jgi:sugar phosphate isomerase/epimerase
MAETIGKGVEAMFRNLNPGAIGIGTNQEGAIRLAKIGGFEGVELYMDELLRMAEERSVDYVKDLFASSGIRPGGWGLPVNWRGEEGRFRADLERLPKYAELASELGAPWTATWVLSFSDELPYEENFRWHLERFRPIAEILARYGCRLGLEFLGPKTLRDNHRYEFIHTIGEMLKLCEEIGTGNVGLLLDSWHWYTSHGTLEDLKRLKAEDVVYVHVNDAPYGVPIDEQIDNVRCLPGETGVIDLVGFLKVLKDIGYDGPVTPEPFSKKLEGLPPDEAVRMVGDALGSIWERAVG